MKEIKASYQKYATLRDNRGITDYRVATDTGIATATISAWKSGIYSPKIDKLQAIAKLFNVPLTELLDDEQRKDT